MMQDVNTERNSTMKIREWQNTGFHYSLSITAVAHRAVILALQHKDDAGCKHKEKQHNRMTENRVSLCTVNNSCNSPKPGKEES
jgi:hypothetical protein